MYRDYPDESSAFFIFHFYLDFDDPLAYIEYLSYVLSNVIVSNQQVVGGKGRKCTE